VRLFVAAHLSHETRTALRATQETLAHAVAAARVPPRITWANPDIAHVTLRFIGEVPEPLAAPLGAALRDPFDLPAFETVWSTIGVFPAGRAGARSPKTIWLGVTSGAVEIQKLAHLVEVRVAPIVGGGDDRAFTAHLTLGRVRDPGRGVDWAAALASAAPPPTSSRIERVTLYRSQLSPRGPTYTALCDTILGPLPPATH